jgi:hypothetical protein
MRVWSTFQHGLLLLFTWLWKSLCRSTLHCLHKSWRSSQCASPCPKSERNEFRTSSITITCNWKQQTGVTSCNRKRARLRSDTYHSNPVMSSNRLGKNNPRGVLFCILPSKVHTTDNSLLGNTHKISQNNRSLQFSRDTSHNPPLFGIRVKWITWSTVSLEVSSINLVVCSAERKTQSLARSGDLNRRHSK